MEKDNVRLFKDNEFLVKILLFGSDKDLVEKNLYHLNRTKQDFSESLGLNIYSQKLFNNENIFRVNIWHLLNNSGSAIKRNIEMFGQGANGVLYLFDGADPDSLNEIEKYIELSRDLFNDSVIRVLVGDFTHGQKITTDMAEDFAKHHNLLFSERFTSNLDVILIALSNLSLNKHLSPMLCHIFSSPTISQYSGSVKELLEPEKTVAAGADAAGAEGTASEAKAVSEKSEIWKEIWASIWENLKEEERLIIHQRLSFLESELNSVLSGLYLSQEVISPLLEFFQIEELERTQLPGMILNWSQNSPEKIDAIKRFLSNEDGILKDYWREFYLIRRKIIERKLEILNDFKKGLDGVILKNEKMLAEINNSLKMDEIPRRTLINMAELAKFIENLIDKK